MGGGSEAQVGGQVAGAGSGWGGTSSAVYLLPRPLSGPCQLLLPSSLLSGPQAPAAACLLNKGRLLLSSAQHS